VKWTFDENRPIWLQLIERLRQRIATGVYPPGQRLPSVRELSCEAGVNPNTMQRALAQLEIEGLAVTNRTVGRQVTGDSAVIGDLRQRLAREKIEEFLTSMEVLGYSAGEVVGLLRDGKEQ